MGCLLATTSVHKKHSPPHTNVMKNRTFLSNALLLTISAIICKVIGALYKVPLTNILGSEGMGLYQLIFPIYALLITISTGGIPATMSSIPSMDDKSLVKVAVSYSVAISGVLTLLVLALAPTISTIQGNPHSTLGYVAIAPSILLTGVIAPLRGYFMRKLNMTPTAISQLIEQVVKLIAGLTLSIYLVPRGVEYGVVGALLGISLSELVSAIYLSILYLRHKPTPSLSLSLPNHYSFTRLATYSIPITVGSLIVPLSSMLDSLIVVNILSPLVGVVEATSLYGIASASVGSLINVPIVVAVSIATAILPSLSSLKDNGDRDSLSSKCSTSLKYCYAVSILAVVVFCTCASYIVDILYPVLSTSHKVVASNLIVLSSVSIIFLSSSNIYSAMLQGVGVPMVNVKVLVVGVIVRVISTVCLLPSIGIYGWAIGGVACYFTTHMLSMRYFGAFCKKNQDMVKFVGKITLSGVIIFVVISILTRLSYDMTIPAVLIGGCVYLALLVKLGVIDKREFAK